MQKNNQIQNMGSPRGTADIQRGEIIIYQTSKNEVKLDVHLEKETVWLNLNQIAFSF